ncbi:MAG: response regulator, partial [Desulfobacula sp.]|nr:response regulator [Desulfobacula sp.]
DKFDLIITDMQMPNMPGEKLSAELIKIRSDIPILLCTGFSETMSEKRAASLGIKGFLLKPIVMNDLAQKIREVLDKK